MPFSSLPYILSLFSQQLLRLFIQGWTFLLLGCHFCSGPVLAIFILLLKTFCCDYGSQQILIVLLIVFTPSCCSYCHCSTGSNSHTVVLSKPASYSPVLFSIPIKRREHAYQSFMFAYGYGESMAVVQSQYISGCSKSLIKVRRKYAVSKEQVRLGYGKSTVKYDKSIVLYGNYF